jgi:hypothetical protein
MHVRVAWPRRASARLPCRHAKLSHPLHARAAARGVLSVLRLRGYIGPLPHAYCPPSTIRWSTGEPPSTPLSASAAAAVETPSHRLPFLSRRSRSSSGPRSSSQTSSATSSSPVSPGAGAAPVRSASMSPPSSVCFQGSPPYHAGAS